MPMWYRIDKGDGKITVVPHLKVVEMARNNYDSSLDVVLSGRFVTPFAIYSRDDKLTDSERKSLVA